MNLLGTMRKVVKPPGGDVSIVGILEAAQIPYSHGIQNRAETDDSGFDRHLISIDEQLSHRSSIRCFKLNFVRSQLLFLKRSIGRFPFHYFLPPSAGHRDSQHRMVFRQKQETRDHERDQRSAKQKQDKN